jgi:hypothetical protein
MRQALTFSATIENDHVPHENAGCDHDTGAAHDIRGGRYGCGSDQRPTRVATHKLNLILGDKNHAFGGSISQTYQPSGRGRGLSDCIAGFRRGDFPAHIDANGERVIFAK